MGNNWRAHRTISFLVIGLTLAGLLGFGFNLEDKLFNFITWKWLLIGGQAYLAWAFKNLLNF